MFFCACVFAALPPSHSAAKVRFAIPAGLATDTLRHFSAQCGPNERLLYAVDAVAGISTHAVHGDFTPRQALDAMLAGSGLHAVSDSQTGALVITRATTAAASAEKPPAPRATPLTPTPTMKRKNPLTVLGALLAFVVGSGTANGADNTSAAQSTGAITGRVLNVTNGNYLNNARVTVDGTTLEAFTNDFGEYWLTNVPAGAATVRAAYTGLTPQTAAVTVAAGQRATHDFSLARDSRAGETVVLGAFVIAAQKEMSGQEIAVNEQRYAANLKNVVSSDEFGDVAEGNLGEFLKFIPGVTIDQVGPDARNISLRGLPPEATAVMVDGAPMASAASSTASRIFELEQVSINNVSRIEITKSPTPDTPANAVGGSVNMVSRSAFERSKPLFSYRAYLNWNADQGFFEKTKEGPSRDTMNHTNPSFDFSYIRPVNKNFGFTISGSHSDAYNADYRATPVWLPGAGGGTALAPISNPFMRNYTTFYGPKVTQRENVGATIDWRLSHGNVFSFGAQWNYYDAFFNNKGGNLNTMGAITNLAPTAWGPTFTQGRPGGASADRGGSARRKYGTTGHFSLKYMHDGPVWKIDAGATWSDATNHYRDGEKGFTNTPNYTLSGFTLRLDDIDQTIGVPRGMSATTAAGAPLDVGKLANYRINNFIFNEADSRDLVSSGRVNARRDFNLPAVQAPLHVRLGLDFRRMDRDISDHRRTRYTFVGPDRSSAATSTDDLAGLYDLVDHNFYRDGQSGFGEPWMEYPSNHKLYDLWAAHPEYFVEDVAFRIQNEATDSKKLRETISAAYLRTDWRFFNNRLQIVGGVRYERTDDEGEGVKNDPTALYQRNATGDLIRGANGLPVRITGLSVEQANRLQFVTRGAHAKRNYDSFFPSANVVFNLTRDLLLRASYAETISRPNLDQIIPGMTITDPNTTNTNNLLITVNNTGLNPWRAANTDVGLEYYFGKNGSNVISVGGFRKDIKDFFGNTRVDATPELLESFGLDDSYLNYDVTYRTNAGDATVTGLDINYRQALTFLPNWARGAAVFYNMTSQHLEGSSVADFRTFVRRNDNYGFTVSRPKFTVRLKVNDRGRQRQAAITGANLPGGTYRYQAPRRTLDVDFEFRFHPRMSFFVAGRNVLNEPSTFLQTYGPGSLEYARVGQYWEHDVNYVMGFKGSF